MMPDWLRLGEEAFSPAAVWAEEAGIMTSSPAVTSFSAAAFSAWALPSRISSSFMRPTDLAADCPP